MIKLGNHLGVGFEILAVTVPPGAGDADKGHTGFNHPPRHQRLLTEERRAVAITDPLGFQFDVEKRLAAH